VYFKNTNGLKFTFTVCLELNSMHNCGRFPDSGCARLQSWFPCSGEAETIWLHILEASLLLNWQQLRSGFSCKKMLYYFQFSLSVKNT